VAHARASSISELYRRPLRRQPYWWASLLLVGAAEAALAASLLNGHASIAALTHPVGAALDGVTRWAWLDDVVPTRRLWAGAAAALAALLLGASCAPAPCPCSYSHVVNVAADDLPALLYLGALAAAVVMSQAVRVAVKLDVLRARALATQGAICGAAALMASGVLAGVLRHDYAAAAAASHDPFAALFDDDGPLKIAGAAALASALHAAALREAYRRGLTDDVRRLHGAALPPLAMIGSVVLLAPSGAANVGFGTSPLGAFLGGAGDDAAPIRYSAHYIAGALFAVAAAAAGASVLLMVRPQKNVGALGPARMHARGSLWATGDGATTATASGASTPRSAAEKAEARLRIPRDRRRRMPLAPDEWEAQVKELLSSSVYTQPHQFRSLAALSNPSSQLSPWLHEQLQAIGAATPRDPDGRARAARTPRGGAGAAGSAAAARQSAWRQTANIREINRRRVAEEAAEAAAAQREAAEAAALAALGIRNRGAFLRWARRLALLTALAALIGIWKYFQLRLDEAVMLVVCAISGAAAVFAALATAIDRWIGQSAQCISRSVERRRQRVEAQEAAEARAREVLQGEPLLERRFVRRSDDLAMEELWRGDDIVITERVLSGDEALEA